MIGTRRLLVWPAVLTTKPDVLPGPIVELFNNLLKSKAECGPDEPGFQCVAGHTIGTIFVIGGTSAVSPAVEAALAKFGTVTRIQGDNRSRPRWRLLAG
jgi:hypothetical protein